MQLAHLARAWSSQPFSLSTKVLCFPPLRGLQESALKDHQPFLLRAAWLLWGWGGSCEDSDLELEPRFSLSSPLGPPTPGVVRRVSFVGCHLAVSGMTPLATLGQFLEQVLCRWSVHLSTRYEWAGMSSAGVARPSHPQLGL